MPRFSTAAHRMMSTTRWVPEDPAYRVTDTIWTSPAVTDSHLVQRTMGTLCSHVRHLVARRSLGPTPILNRPTWPQRRLARTAPAGTSIRGLRFGAAERPAPKPRELAAISPPARATGAQSPQPRSTWRCAQSGTRQTERLSFRISFDRVLAHYALQPLDRLPTPQISGLQGVPIRFRALHV